MLGIKHHKIISAIIPFSALLIGVLIVFNNRNTMIPLILLSLLITTLFGIRHFLIIKLVNKNLDKILLLIAVLAIFSINYIDVSNFSQIYFYLIVSDIIIFHFNKYCFIYMGIGYFLLILTIYLKYTRWNYFDFLYLFPNIIENSFYFVFIIGMIYIAGYQTNQSQILSKTMNELEIKSNELKEVNNKLQKTMESLEEMTILRERNRIAREIHDTVGHTLTTVSIEIEAGKRLAPKDLNLALEKLELAQEQVRKGLSDIRSSVKLLKNGNGVLSFIPSVQALISETELHAGVSVRSSFSQLPFLNSEQERVLYHVVQEGLTNGIRHGKCSEFALQLKYINNRIMLTLTDNGKGCGNITLGFGLTAMKERIEELRGEFSVKSSLGNGCSLKVDIPIEEECINEYY